MSSRASSMRMKEEKKVEKSIRLVKSFGVEYRLIKTYTGSDYIGNDIDVLVENPTRWVEYLLDNSFGIIDRNQKEIKVLMGRPGCTSIHLHGAIRWCGVDFMDFDYAWQYPRLVSYHGEDVVIPNYNADFLSHIAHMTYEKGQVSAREVRYLTGIAGSVGVKAMTEQLIKHSWNDTFTRTCSQMWKLSSKKKALPRSHLILAVMEKRLYGYVLRRLPKTLWILLTGNTGRYLNENLHNAPLST